VEVRREKSPGYSYNGVASSELIAGFELKPGCQCVRAFW